MLLTSASLIILDAVRNGICAAVIKHAMQIRSAIIWNLSVEEESHNSEVKNDERSEAFVFALF